MTYIFNCDFVDYEIVRKEKTGRRYIYYHFRDMETGDTHVLYDHRNDSNEAKVVELHKHRHLQVGGRVTARGSHQYLNFDFWGVLIDDKVYNPLTMQEGVRRIGLSNDVDPK